MLTKAGRMLIDSDSSVVVVIFLGDYKVPILVMVPDDGSSLRKRAISTASFFILSLSLRFSPFFSSFIVVGRPFRAY